mmetsp:Transcript_37040/g.73370  ORF Transcript_37040/g.73370 Transcript_37040/m.73370 type:complete len:425 (-) Transcript_37040:298-1572(-)
MRAVVLALTLLASSAEASTPCDATCTGTGATRACSYTFTLDYFASTTGYYKVAECGDDVQPTLTMEAGIPYDFIQEDATNWYHPLGFAYFADGAHAGVDELEPGLSPDTPSSGCIATNTCQSPQYYLGTVPMADQSDNEDFGLDVYEPWFQRAQGDWSEHQAGGDGPYNVKVTIADDNTQELFYFCHVHGKMSGHILVKTGEGGGFRGSGAPTLPLGYTLAEPSAFDQQCGTFAAFEYSDEGNGADYCPSESMVCPGSEENPFAKCLKAINCKMMTEMTVKHNDENPAVTFMHQMLPHHVNAVNMAKALLKDVQDKGETLDEEIHELVVDIINVQNKQNMLMNGYLTAHGFNPYPEYESEVTDCDSEPEHVPTTCRISHCGCSPEEDGSAYKYSWCTDDISYTQSDWCQKSKENCEGSCNGKYC